MHQATSYSGWDTKLQWLGHQATISRLLSFSNHISIILINYSERRVATTPRLIPLAKYTYTEDGALHYSLSELRPTEPWLFMAASILVYDRQRNLPDGNLTTCCFRNHPATS
jgi:hypothetical protein